MVPIHDNRDHAVGCTQKTELLRLTVLLTPIDDKHMIRESSSEDQLVDRNFHLTNAVQRLG